MSPENNVRTAPASGPDLRRTAGLILILLAHPLVFIPCTIYLGNVQEFTSPPGAILRTYAALALPVTVMLLLIAAVTPARVRPVTDTVLAVLGLLVWAQANILAWDYGLFDGHGIAWDEHRVAGWIDAALWLAVLGLAVRYARQVGRFAVPFAYVIFAAQIAVTGAGFFQARDELPVRVDPDDARNALQQTFRFSPDRNVVQIVLDGFQADIFDAIVNDGNSGKFFRDALPGFVFFRDHMGSFPTTYMSIPAFTSGRIYDNTTPKKRFMRESLEAHSILKLAHDAGYAIDLVGPAELIAHYRGAPHEHAYAIPDGFPVSRENAVFSEAARVLDLALFRATPQIAKRWIYNDQKWRVAPLVLRSEASAFDYFSHTAYARLAGASLTTDRGQPVYKLLHLMSTHWPMVVDDACRLRAGPYLTTRASTTAQSRCSLAAVTELLDGMRREGIYDDALIVVMADHGAQLPPPRFEPARAPGNIIPDPWIAAQATPLLAIKLPGARAPFAITEVPSSGIDIPATIAAVLGLDGGFDGVQVFGLEPGTQRERRFYAYEWTRADWESEYAGDIQEFLVSGSVYNGDWRLGRVFPAPAK